MISFTGDTASTTSHGARMGLLQSQGKSFQTPSYVGLTSRGVIPHITPDLAAKHVSTHVLYYALEDFIENSVASSALLCPPSRFNTTLKDLTGVHDDPIIVLGQRRVPPVAGVVSNTDSSITVRASTGFQTLDEKQFEEVAHKIQPDIVVGLADLPLMPTVGRRRQEKMRARTERWAISYLKSCSAKHDGARPFFFAPVLPIKVEEQMTYLKSIANEGKGITAGVAVYELESLTQLPQHCSELCRLSLYNARSPHDILELISQGADLVTAPFVEEATGAGIGLIFAWRVAEVEQQSMRHNLGLDMMNPAFATDLAPIVKDCACHTCQVHTRAYIQHLLNAKEMLALTLLQLHNMFVVEEFFKAIRNSITAGDFEEMRQIFHQTYQRTLATRVSQD